MKRRIVIFYTIFLYINRFDKSIRFTSILPDPITNFISSFRREMCFKKVYEIGNLHILSVRILIKAFIDLRLNHTYVLI